MKTSKKTGLLVILISLFFSMQTIAQEQENTANIKIKSSVICGSCKSRIEQNMTYVKGVKEVSVNLSSKEVSIDYNPKKTTPEALKIAITKIGYDADDLIADDAAYSKLPACCKKDAAPHE